MAYFATERCREARKKGPPPFLLGEEVRGIKITAESSLLGEATCSQASVSIIKFNHSDMVIKCSGKNIEKSKKLNC